MSVETRTYDNENGDPVIVMVISGTFDVSRHIALHQRGRCEDVGYAAKMLRQVKRHNGGRAALSLLKAHGGQDFTDSAEDFDEVLRIALDVRHQAWRWENPLDEPAWIQPALNALGQPDAKHCDQCSDAPRRLARDRAPSPVPELIDGVTS